jgi:hypothetical protein
LNPTAAVEEENPTPSVTQQTLAPQPKKVEEQLTEIPGVGIGSLPNDLPWDDETAAPAPKVDVAAAFDDLFNS